ncbi:MAG: acyloxyacyl hydrolase [Bacteroidota bacterium]
MSLLQVLLVLFFLYPAVLNAQFKGTVQGVSLSPKLCYVLPHRSTMQHLTQGHAHSIDIGTVWQYDGSRAWHDHFNRPKFGFYANYTNFGFREVLGESVGVQSFLYLPYFRTDHWAFGSKVSAGVAYVSKKFDQQKNPKNNAIGSHLNGAVTIGVLLERQFDCWSAGFEVSMAHWSNGAYRLPNLGLNVPYLALNVDYYFEAPKQEEQALEQQMPSVPKWRLGSQLIASAKEVYPTGGNRYGVASFTQYVQYRIGKVSYLEWGADAIYNQSITAEVEGDYSQRKNWQLGSYLGYVLPVQRFELIIGMGRYLLNPLNPRGMWYHKFGGRLRLTDRIMANISIKSHWAKADYFEYGITYEW